MENKSEYFTAGELASLYGIPKQTLLYYDKNELLLPAFVNEHGYRYYSVSQYLILEIILNLRKLDVPINTIKQYLQERTAKNFQQLLTNKIQDCNNIIEKMVNIRDSLTLSISSLQQASSCRLEQIELVVKPGGCLLLSDIIEPGTSVRERVKSFAQHNQQAFANNRFKDFSTGWIIRRADYLSHNFCTSSYYFTPLPAACSRQSCRTLPEGLYLSINFRGTFYKRGADIFQKLELFMNRNDLEIISDVYVLPLKNHWMSMEPDDYINQVYFQVEDKGLKHN